MKKEVLLYSGGLDSYFAREFLHIHKNDFDCLYFNHNGRYCRNEIERIKFLPFDVIIDDRLQLKDLETESAFIPNRNILLAILANSIGYEKVWLGGTKSDRIADNCPQVFESLSTFLTMMNSKYFITTSPFWDVYKTDVIKWFLKQRSNNICVVSHELLKNTFSCYNPLPDKRESVYYFMNIEQKNIYLTEECMNCAACFRKNVELFSIGISLSFNNKDIIKKYKDEFTNCLIETPRSKNTLSYIKEVNLRS